MKKQSGFVQKLDLNKNFFYGKSMARIRILILYGVKAV